MLITTVTTLLHSYNDERSRLGIRMFYSFKFYRKGKPQVRMNVRVEN